MNQKDSAADFASRLNAAFNAVGAPSKGRAPYIAKRLPYSISVVAIRKWLVGDAIPDTKKLADIAALAGTSVEYLLGHQSSGNEASVPGAQPAFAALRKVPILSTVQAGNWAESLTFEQLGEDVEWQETSAKVGEDAFALRVRGNSMTNPHGSPSIPHGSVVIVQPCPDPESGKIVVAMLKGSDEATIKKLEIDGPHKYLVPLNPTYQHIMVNGNCRIVGFVRQVIMDLD
ncbi:Cro/Cl family transcriptional regulator [Veronia pacifica]|uniref:Cro/Cl family transcriptional regulator n=1 Tax=Veronia pacifica TaxID=1080227 RepID=A0A1C3E9D9_9GAMM|nr:Cro/Cl family transcriptional regulator [Veronia pacifica]